MQLPFGKKVTCGSYYVWKHTKTLSAKELKALRKSRGVPKEIQKQLSRGTMPYITVGTLSDSWRIDFCIGMTMYNAIDEIPVAVDAAGNVCYFGNGYQNLGNIINGWFAYTSTVGDAEYQATVIKAMQDYLSRMSKENDKPLSKEEAEKILDEEESKEKHQAVLLQMSNEIQKGDKDEQPGK